MRGYWLLAERGKAGEIYNVGAGKGTRLADVVAFLKKESSATFKVVRLKSKYRRNDIPRIVLDSAKLRKIGWRPERSIWEGLRELLEEWREKVHP